MCEALIYLLDNIYIRFGTKLYRQIVGIPMGTNCAPLVTDLFLFCYERDFMTSLSDVKQAEIIEAFKSTSRYLDDLLNIDNPYFEGMVNRIYPPELQLNKANTSDTEAQLLDLNLSNSKGFVSSNIYDKRDDFDFDIVNFPFLDGDVPRSTPYGVYISQLIRFAIVSSHVADFNARNKSLTAKLLQQGYRYHKLPLGFNDNIYHEGNISKMPDFDVFSLLEIRKRKSRSHGIRKKGNGKRKKRAVKRSNTSLKDLSKVLEDHGRHSMLSLLSSLPISVLRILDTEANKFYDRNHQLYDAALLTRCYTQHALRPFIDSEINHKRHFIKIPFINKGIEFIDLPSIFKDRSVTSSIPAYFQNSEPPIICYKYNKPFRNTVFNFNKLVSDLDIHANTPES